MSRPVWRPLAQSTIADVAFGLVRAEASEVQLVAQLHADEAEDLAAELLRSRREPTSGSHHRERRERSEPLVAARGEHPLPHALDGLADGVMAHAEPCAYRDGRARVARLALVQHGAPHGRIPRRGRLGQDGIERGHHRQGPEARRSAARVSAMASAGSTARPLSPAGMLPIAPCDSSQPDGAAGVTAAEAVERVGDRAHPPVDDADDPDGAPRTTRAHRQAASRRPCGRRRARRR